MLQVPHTHSFDAVGQGQTRQFSLQRRLRLLNEFLKTPTSPPDERTIPVRRMDLDQMRGCCRLIDLEQCDLARTARER